MPIPDLEFFLVAVAAPFPLWGGVAALQTITQAPEGEYDGKQRPVIYRAPTAKGEEERYYASPGAIRMLRSLEIGVVSYGTAVVPPYSTLVVGGAQDGPGEP